MPKGKVDKVRQLDYFTGELIEVYESLNAAAYDNFTNAREIRNALKDRNGMMPNRKIRFEIVR